MGRWRPPGNDYDPGLQVSRLPHSPWTSTGLIHQAHLDGHVAGIWEVRITRIVQAFWMMVFTSLQREPSIQLHLTLSCRFFRGSGLGASPKKCLLIGPTQSLWSYPYCGTGLAMVTWCSSSQLDVRGSLCDEGNKIGPSLFLDAGSYVWWPQQPSESSEEHQPADAQVKDGSERIWKETESLLRPQSLWVCRSWKLPSLGASYCEAHMSFLARLLLILIAVHVPCHQTRSVSSALLHSLSKGPSEERFLQKHLNNTWCVCPESPHLGSKSSLVDNGSWDHSLSGHSHKSGFTFCHLVSMKIACACHS